MTPAESKNWVDGLQSQSRIERLYFVVYFTQLSVQTTNGRMMGIRKGLVGSGHVLFKVLFLTFA
jgi:hypothetical protein